MNVSGFTFIKNGLTLGYPILESVQSIDPLCDEIIINVGYNDPNLQKDDGTYDYLRDHLKGDRYIFLKSHWDPEKTSQGLVLSEQTNIALEKCRGKFCHYIQGDEAIHEEDLAAIEAGIKEMEQDNRMQGLIYNYIHFYGNVNSYLHTRRIYRREVRLIKNGLKIKSWLDAQGFRHRDNTKLFCKLIPARIFHYGWARKEQIMATKVKAMDKLYHGNDFEADKFEYKRIWGLKQFKQTHPKVMKNWIESHRNEIDIHKLKLSFNRKDISLAISDFVEKYTGYRMGEYKNYRRLS